MSDTLMLEERLRSFIAAPEDSDWQDVVRRADAMAAARGRRGWRVARGRLSRPVLIAAAAVAAVAGAGVAIAAGFGVLDGIGAAQHPQGPADALDPVLVAQVKRENAELASSPVGQTTGQMLLDSTRFIRRLASGERVYALTTTKDKLCVLLVGRPGSNMSSAMGCGDPLNQDEPTTIAGVRPNPATPPLTYGIAIDGVSSVSFRAAGVETTVPVKENVWAYEGSSNALRSLTVHYADGTTKTLTAGRADPNQRTQPPKAGQAGQASAQPAPPSSSGQAHPPSDWRAAINDLLIHRGKFTHTYRCTSVRIARAKIAALPHHSPYLPTLDAYIKSHC